MQGQHVQGRHVRKGEGLVRLTIRGGRTSNERECRVGSHAVKVSPADLSFWTAE